MNPALIFKLRPLGPWRSGPENGARDRVDTLFHSDSLYSAVTAAMAALGSLNEWLDATARCESGPAVCFSSCFPFQEDVGFVTPPRGVWPPMVSSKVRWKGARFVPLHVVDALLSGDVLDEDRWSVDGASECLVMSGIRGPFRVAMRSNAAVDRLGQAVTPHATACLEFTAGAGLWGVAAFAGEAEQTRWSPLVQAALRLLGDSGLGGERSRGWGRFETPEFDKGTLIEGTLPELLLPRTGARSSPSPAPNGEGGFWDAPGPSSERLYWLLSLFSPAPADAVDWERGNYSLVTRGGRVESPAGSGQLKKMQNMVAEGSVLAATGAVNGTAADVAPDGFPHPVYRAGFAMAIAIPSSPQAAPPPQGAA